MTTEENKRMLALSCILADLKAENMELVERVHQLVDEYNNVAHQLIGKKNRKNKDSSKQTIDEMQQMREQCEHLKRKNKELERFAKAMHEFVIDKNLYIKKNNECPYWHRGIPVCSTYCLECSSCLGVLERHGVICGQRLKEANVSILSL